MDQPLLPQAVGELLPSSHSSAASSNSAAATNSRGQRGNITVLALGSERADGRPPDEPTPAQLARDQAASRHGTIPIATAGGGASSGINGGDNSTNDDDSSDRKCCTCVGMIIAIAVVIIIPVVVNTTKSSSSSYNPGPSYSYYPTLRPTVHPAYECQDTDDGWATLCPIFSSSCLGSQWEHCCICGGGQTCKDTPNWTDSIGDGCDWYVNAQDSCNDYPGSMGSASDNCCVCGGGSSSTKSNPSGSSSSSSLPTPLPTTKPTYPKITPPTTTGCKDTPNWIDGDGDGCDWYREVPSSLCDEYPGPMGTAKENCCVCGKGSQTTTVTKTPQPSIVPTSTSSSNLSESMAPTGKPITNPSHYLEG